MRIKKGMFFIVILIGSLIGSANMKEVKAEDSDSIEDIVELSLLYSCLLYTSPSPRDA